MAGPGFAERLAHALLTIAARRWPAELAEIVRAEWAAELAALRGRPRHMLTFAGSLAAASPPGFRWAPRAAAGTAVALLVLIAAALFNGVRLALHRVETVLHWSGEALFVGALLTAAMLLMATAGARWAPRRRLRATLLTGLLTYAFLLAGNETAVMPFMGWRDVTPAVATWTVLALLTGWATARLRAAGHDRTAVTAAIVGGLLAVEAAAIAGCLHAATVLGVPMSSAPAWFPLAMLPGGTGGFGVFFPGGHPGLGTLHGSGTAFHASDILLAGAATMTGPLLLCTAFLTAALLRNTASKRHDRSPAASRRNTAPGRHDRSPATHHGLAPALRRVSSALMPAARNRVDPRIVAGSITAAVVLLAAGWLPRATTTADLVLPRVVDNSTVFGFGFLAHPGGRAVLAFAVALFVVHHLAPSSRSAAIRDPHLTR